METYKIWYIGGDKKLISTLEKNVSGSGISIKHYMDDGTLKEVNPASWPDILIVDLDIDKSISLMEYEPIRDAMANSGMVTAYIAHKKPSSDSLSALAAGFDLCWDAHNNDRNLLRAVLQREVAKNKEATSAAGETENPVNHNQRVYNETVAALADGAVELLKLKEDVEKRNTKLRLVRDELEQFVHTVSHDLKEPLMAVRTFTAMLMEELEGVKGKAGDNIGRIKESVDLMTRQIDSLLEFSRAGRVNEDAEVGDLGSLIEDVIHARGYDNRNDVRVSIAASLPPIKGAEQQIKQVFSNLISNAIKHNNSPKKEVGIDIVPEPPEEIKSSFGNGEIPAGQALFRVSDNGYGIPGDDHEAPFELFRRLVVDDATDGDGAGLAIVKRAVTSLGGSIDYVSEPGHGTAMYFTLPIARKFKTNVKKKSAESKRSIAQLKEALRQ